jgi:hypothetical protein
MMTLSDEERHRAEDAHQERTPGPWRVGHDPTTVVVGEGGEGFDRPRMFIADVAGHSRRSGEEARANTLFIVEAVNEHDGLTVALEAARARVAELEHDLSMVEHDLSMVTILMSRATRTLGLRAAKTP